MKALRIFLMAAVLTLVFGFPARAQFYAPDTEFHDRSQRLFPVEMLRVLAWRENAGRTNIAEVSYEVKVDTDRVTTWKLNCLDGAGKAVKQIKVSYPETLLSSGPKYYREVFGQIWKQGNWRPLTNLTAADLNANFWKGAAMNGLARDTGLRAAFDLIQAKPAAGEATLAPELGGLLTHAALPSLCAGVTLDSMLMARGAAWLALSEAMLPTGSHAADENWTPVIFMAGREIAARGLWKANVPVDSKMNAQPVLFQWWNFFIARPKSRAAFEFACDAKMRRYGMPMMAYYSRLVGLGAPFARVIPIIYGDDVRGLYDYGTFIMGATDIGGGRMLEGAWPALFRAEWVETLTKLPESPADFQGYKTTLAAIPKEFKPAKDDEASLAGLPEMAPLLDLGFKQGIGSLAPTAVVTSRDLLNYGWEMNSLQMGTRYYFVNELWGIPDLAESIFENGTRNIGGQAIFFKNNLQKESPNLQEIFKRIQMVDDVAWRTTVDVQPFSRDVTDAAAAQKYYKTLWLRPYEVRMECFTLARSGQTDEFMRLMHRYHEECGLKADEIMVEYLSDWNLNEMKGIPGLHELEEMLAESLPEPTGLKVKVLRGKLYDHLDNGDEALAYEKIFWENPDANLEQPPFNNYFNAGAWKSAKRFYMEARKTIEVDVNFQTLMTPKAWMLGFLSGDEELMSAATKDSSSGSFSAMNTLYLNALAHDDLENAKLILAEITERYEPNEGQSGSGARLTGFLPLIPALRDPKDPKHEEALDYFGKGELGIVTRWILIQKCKLPKDEAIRFLGGNEVDRIRRVLAMYLEDDKTNIDAARVDYIATSTFSGANRVLVNWLEFHLLNAPPKVKDQDTDLKPPGARSIVQAVALKLSSQ